VLLVGTAEESHINPVSAQDDHGWKNEYRKNLCLNKEKHNSSLSQVGGTNLQIFTFFVGFGLSPEFKLNMLNSHMGCYCFHRHVIRGSRNGSL
jgi:hypothetical protein